MAKENTLTIAKTPSKGKDDRPKVSALPTGRRSSPTEGRNQNGILGGNQYKTVTPNYIREMIPVLRMLMMSNPDVGQAIHNMVTLGNTGHKVHFDKKVPVEQVDAMRNHLNNKRKVWASGQAGMDGLINRFFTQILIGGALSNEWVVDKDLKGIESVILINPEDIEFVLDKNGTKYQPYQRVKNGLVPFAQKNGPVDLIKLNTNTYQYYALNGDGELPYGFPPYMSVIPRIKTQSNMDKNINFVIDQMGLVGFIEALIDKPDRLDTETDDKTYEARLDRLLITAKDRMLSSFKEGVVVGFKEDHEFGFHSASKTFGDVVELYKNNELMLASALKQDASLWGRSYATSETQISVVFVKMLSEFKNIQNLIKTNLEFGYALELRLAGFNFNYLEVKFNKSTIQDDLKSQQAEEYKIKNVRDKMILGIIDQDTAADEMGYETSAFPKPLVSWEVLAGGSDPKAEGALEADKSAKKRVVKKGKTASAKKVRRAAKPLPTK